MDPATTLIFGALIGVVASLITTWFNIALSGSKEKRDNKRKRHLEKIDRLEVVYEDVYQHLIFLSQMTISPPDTIEKTSREFSFESTALHIARLQLISTAEIAIQYQLAVLGIQIAGNEITESQANAFEKIAINARNKEEIRESLLHSRNDEEERESFHKTWIEIGKLFEMMMEHLDSLRGEID